MSDNMWVRRSTSHMHRISRTIIRKMIYKQSEMCVITYGGQRVSMTFHISNSGISWEELVCGVMCFIMTTGKLCAQELGQIQSYGPEGRLYSRDGDDEYYLLSRQSYLTEDSSGYEGQISVKTYSGGGYQVKIMRFTARCRAPFDNFTYVWIGEPEDDSAQTTTNIQRADNRPSKAHKTAYNLYWAACEEQFEKFK